jgi:hypothetical protein
MKPTWKGVVDVKGKLGDAFGPGDGGGLRLELGANELAIDDGWSWVRRRWAKR